MTERNEVLEFLDTLIGADEEIRREAEKERLRLALALAMVRARKAAGLSQAEVADRLGVTQSWVSRLENPDIAHTFESIVEYLQAIGAHLDMAIRAKGHEFTISRPASKVQSTTGVEESAGTSLETFWQAPSSEAPRTLVFFFSSKTAALPTGGGSELLHAQIREEDISIPELSSPDAATSGIGGHRGTVN